MAYIQPEHEVVVVGAGFGGIGAGIALKRAGIDDFVILERAGDIGGTWRDNTYPGVAVDIPSFSYQYSFEPNANWSRVFAKGAEVKAYADHCADKYGLRPHLRLNTEVTGRAWDEENDLWRISLGGGEEVTARWVITALGAFVDPKPPNIPGLEEFAGKVIQSMRWDHDHDLAGERVAVIGTGASAVQLVPPVAERASQLHVFQRRPIWVFAKADYRIPPWAQRMFERVPITQKVVRFITSIAVEAGLVAATLYGRKIPAAEQDPGACLSRLHAQPGP